MPATAADFENNKKTTLQKKIQISQIPMLRGRGHPNRLRPGGGQIPDTIEILDDFVSGFGRPIAEPPIFTSVASRLYSPHLKDCLELGTLTL